MTRLRLLLLITTVLCLGLAPQNASAATIAQRVTALEKSVASIRTTNKAQDTKIAGLTTKLAAANASISSLKTANAALTAKIASTDTSVTALKARAAALEAAPVMGLNPFVSVSADATNGVAGPHVFFTGVNLHLRSGAGETDQANGLGNLIIGYDEMLGSTEASRTGSHNIVLGHGNKFSSFGGFVGGWGNWISGPFASVFDGSFNTASGGNAAVLTGEHNTATASDSSVSGGHDNNATANFSAVSGGSGLTAGTDTSWKAGAYATP
jgi:hypothetical protein